MAVEIERKWVAAEPRPDELLGQGTLLRQGYLTRDGGVTVRVRIAGPDAWLTVKAGGDGLTRTEVEVAVALEDAEALWVHTAGRRVVKTRHRVALDGGLVADVDVFAESLAGLCLVEVEFVSEEEATAFRAPAWFGEEVTGQPEWSNASLAEHGRPPA